MNDSVILPINNENSNIVFSVWDYSIFSLMLTVSAAIGIYFGCFGSKQSSTKEYLMGGNNMKVFPIAMSLLASNISGIALLAVPTDVYRNGASYGLVCLSMVPISLITAYVFLPVFHKLQITSTFEYLKLRFNTKIRTLASVLFTLSMLIYNPIVIYIPALAFAQVTGIDLHIIAPIVCLICIFYTTIGGLKAVVWTDAIQLMAIIASWLIIFVIGLYSVGGISRVIEKSVEGDRLNIFDFDLNPTKRDSFWIVFFGMTVAWMYGSAFSQGAVQRYLSLPSIRDGQITILIVCFGVIFITTISVLTGLIMYAKYYDCDPLTAQKIDYPDQILPYYVMDVAKHIPGLPGLFISGIFSASMSTLSTTLNGVAATIYEDFISRFMPAEITEKQTNNILKLIVVLFGLICTALVFVVEHLGSILPLAVSFGGMINGPLLGLFCLGMLIPFANSKGALYGVFGGLSFIAWIVIGAQYHIAKGTIYHEPKPLSTDGCDAFVNITHVLQNLTNEEIAAEQPLFLYRISFYYYCLIGAFTTVTIGSVVSWFTNDGLPAQRELLSPATYVFLSTDEKKMFNFANYYSIKKALQITYLSNEEKLAKGFKP